MSLLDLKRKNVKNLWYIYLTAAHSYNIYNRHTLNIQKNIEVCLKLN